MTRQAKFFHGVATGHARLDYAGGSWGLSRPIWLRPAVRVRRLNGELAARNHSHGNTIGTGEDGHPRSYSGAATLLHVTHQATVLIIHGMPVDSAVDMDVGDDMAVVMAVMVVRFFRGGRGCCCRNERPFEAERQHSRHHEDDSKPRNQRRQTTTQNYSAPGGYLSDHISPMVAARRDLLCGEAHAPGYRGVPYSRHGRYFADGHPLGCLLLGPCIPPTAAGCHVLAPCVKTLFRTRALRHARVRPLSETLPFFVWGHES